MRTTSSKIIVTLALLAQAGQVQAQSDADRQQRNGRDSTIVVTGLNDIASAGTKTDTPLIETPQPITVIDAETFERQGAISISDTLRYAAGVTANPYGPDSRVDGATVRGVSALQFRDGMRDIYSYYASIRSDPYNFERIELIRGPAGMLFGQGSLGGLFNMVSKTPKFETEGEISLRYGSFDRKEVLGDVTGAITDNIAGRIVAHVRDADTQTDYVPDDRIMISPSLTFALGSDTDLTLLGLYQEDDGGSTSQFLPLVGTILSNPNGRLDNDLFIGKPGWDRYNGRLLQGTALLNHRFSDNVKLSAKARYIDSDLTYFTHYPNSYDNPTNPYLDADQRVIGNYADGSYARMEIFSTDNNVTVGFNTGASVEHKLLGGVDYSWNRVRKESGLALETIDIYDIDYGALSNYGGGIPQAGDPGFIFGSLEDTTQEQLGFYLQDEIRLWDRVSIILGARHDFARAESFGTETYDQEATTYRAGIIGEVVSGISPFFSYTESFEPLIGEGLVPKTGRQFEWGVKFHPTDSALITVTGYRIQENGRPISDDSTPDPDDQIQVDGVTSTGIEFEANVRLPGDIGVMAAYSYNEAEIDGTNQQLDDVPQHNGSLWLTKRTDLTGEISLILGGGVRYVGEHESFGLAFPDGLKTPGYTLVDAYAELGYKQWSLSLNATNLFDKHYYSACLARGDCFMGSERNIYATLTRSF